MGGVRVSVPLRGLEVFGDVGLYEITSNQVFVSVPLRGLGVMLRIP